MTKQNFHQPLLLVSVSHDTSEIILKCLCGAQETVIIEAENSCAA